MKRTLVALVTVVCLSCASVTLAQTPGQTPTSKPWLASTAGAPGAPSHGPEWGISSYIAYVVPGWSFNNLRDSQHARGNFDYIFRSGGTWNFFDQTLFLPSGALVYGVTPMVYDADAGADVEFYFYKETQTDPFINPPTNTEVYSFISSGTPGYEAPYEALDVPETIRNYDLDAHVLNRYILILYLAPSGADEDLAFGGVVVWYKLQISPAPATATFSDVQTDYWAFRHIEALAASGITVGCGGGNYCPENNVTRAEMAVFLAKALGLHWPD